MGFAAAATINDASSIGASFDAFWTAARSQPFREQEALWDTVVERPRQDLYATVVWERRDYPDWQERKDRLLRQRFLDYPQVSDQIPTAARAMRSEIPIQTRRFRGLFPDAAARLPVQLVLAPNFDAKSGVLGDGNSVLVFAVDSLLLERADMSIILPHELFHLYHASRAGIQNDGVMPGADMTLPLFAEGLATYVSSVLSPGHSDGQLLLRNDLGAIPVAALPMVAARFLADADAKAVDSAHPETFARWFMGSKSLHQSDLPNRTGYWLGLHVIRQMRRQYSLHEMASWPPAKAQVQTRATLSAMKERAAIGTN